MTDKFPGVPSDHDAHVAKETACNALTEQLKASLAAQIKDLKPHAQLTLVNDYVHENDLVKLETGKSAVRHWESNLFTAFLPDDVKATNHINKAAGVYHQQCMAK